MIDRTGESEEVKQRMLQESPLNRRRTKMSCHLQILHLKYWELTSTEDMKNLN